MQNKPKYKHTQWRTIPCTKMKIERLNGSAQLSWKIDYGKKNDYLTPSYDSVSEQIRKKVKIDYFLMDEADRKAVKFMTDTFREKWESRCYESMGTLENFTKTLYEVMDNKKEKFYLRALPPLFSDGKPRVFSEDVGYMLLAMRSGRIIDVEDELFDTVCKNLTGVANNAYGTLSLDYIQKLFEAVDFDKSVVTLVDDPIVLCGRKMIYKKGGHFTIQSCRMVPIISVPQGTLFLIHSLVCGVNWKKVSREDKDLIAGAVRKISGVDKFSYIEYSHIISIIIEARKRCKHLYANKPPDYIFPESDPKDVVDSEYYNQIVSEFELFPFPNKYQKFDVYVLRVLLVLGWIVNFTDDRTYRSLAELVMDEVMNYVPEKNQREYRLRIMDVIKSTNNAKKQAAQNGNGIKNGESVSEKSGIVQIKIGGGSSMDNSDAACAHCEKIQNQFWDIQNQLSAHQARRAFLVQERESYNVLIDKIHEQNEEIQMLQAKLENLEKAKPVIHTRGYATECRKLDAENQKLSDRIKFFNNTSSEFQRGINTLTKANEQAQAVNENLEKQIVELKKQTSNLSEFSTKMVEIQTMDQDRIIEDLEESIKNLQIKADRQDEIIKEFDKKAEPKSP